MKDKTLHKSLSILDALSGLPSDEIAESLTLALAIFGVLHRNKTKTLLEHFDAMNSAYRLCFRLVQETGIENDFDGFRKSSTQQTSKGT